MGNGWTDSKRWSDRFLPEIKSILGQALIREPDDITEDQKRNTDLMVLALGDQRIACRIRRHDYLAAYGDEFTIRAGRPNGSPTELQKILAGWGDILFYGFADAAETRLARWFVGDLKVFRWYLKGPKNPANEMYNTDNSSSFIAFALADMPAGFILAQGGAEVGSNAGIERKSQGGRPCAGPEPDEDWLGI